MNSAKHSDSVCQIIRLRDILADLRKVKPYDSLSHVLSISRQIEFADERDLLTDLEVLHEVNDILWHRRDVRTREIVFLDPEFAMDVIKPVVRHDLIKNEYGHKTAMSLYVHNPIVCMQVIDRLKKKWVTISAVDSRKLPIWKGLDPIVFQDFISLLELFGIGYEVIESEKDSSLLLPSHLGVDLVASSSDHSIPPLSTLGLVRAWEFIYFSPSA